MKPNQCVRMVLPGYDREQPIHHTDEKNEDIEGQAKGHDHGKTGQKNIFQIELQNGMSCPFLKKAGYG
jgi:hypothetical protein